MLTSKQCQTAGGQKSTKVTPVHQGAAQGIERSASVTHHSLITQGITVESVGEQGN